MQQQNEIDAGSQPAETQQDESVTPAGLDAFGLGFGSGKE